MNCKNEERMKFKQTKKPEWMKERTWLFNKHPHNVSKFLCTFSPPPRSHEMHIICIAAKTTRKIRSCPSQHFWEKSKGFILGFFFSVFIYSTTFDATNHLKREVLCVCVCVCMRYNHFSKSLCQYKSILLFVLHSKMQWNERSNCNFVHDGGKYSFSL